MAVAQIHEAETWLRTLFDEGDRLAVVLVHPRNGDFVIQRLLTMGEILSADWLDRWAILNEIGFSVYAGVNPLKPDAKTRTKADVLYAQAVFLDLDEDGQKALANVKAELPMPTLLTETSPNRFQIIWRLDRAYSQSEVEAALRAMAKSFGGDPAASDVSRVLRVPGFRNPKWPDAPTSKIIEANPDRRWELKDFQDRVGASLTGSNGVTSQNLQITSVAGTPVPWTDPPEEIRKSPDLVLAWRGQKPSCWTVPKTASERDSYMAVRLLDAGVAPGRVAEIILYSPNRAGGRPKVNLADYIGRTIDKALAYLSGG